MLGNTGLWSIDMVSSGTAGVTNSQKDSVSDGHSSSGLAECKGVLARSGYALMKADWADCM